MMRTIGMLLAIVAGSSAGTANALPQDLLCETVGMDDEDGNLVLFPRPGNPFMLQHDGRDVIDDPASPLSGFPAMIVTDWDDALERFLGNDLYRIVLMDGGIAEDGRHIIRHYPMAGAFETALRDGGLVHFCTPTSDANS